MIARKNTNPDYFDEKVRAYEQDKWRALEENQFPEPLYFCTNSMVLSYDAFDRNWWLSPTEHPEPYALFFAMALHIHPPIPVMQFLGSVAQEFPGDFPSFLQIICAEWQELFSKGKRLAIMDWIQRYQNTVKPKNPQTGNIHSSILEMSHAQVSMVFYFGLRAMGFDFKQETDLTNVARFIQLLKGGSNNNLYGSKLYKCLRTVPFCNSEPQLSKDLDEVRRYFESAGMKEVVEFLKEEMPNS